MEKYQLTWQDCKQKKSKFRRQEIMLVWVGAFVVAVALVCIALGG